MLLLKSLGSEFVRVFEMHKAEYEALKYCKEYSKERNWLFANNIDFRNIPDEQLYQRYLTDFKFRER
jgi:hypothetical protein